ncbi:MAG: response regulator, partial [Terracoccus sp.]
DVRLPDGDGFALTQDLLAMSRPPVVVVVSSDSSTAHVAAAHRAGARGFVAKEDLSEDTMRSLLDSQDRS